MGIIQRHPGAPHIDGEILTGTALEQDISEAFNVLSGNLSDANVKVGADFSGTKLAAGSVAGSRIKDNTIATAKIAALTLGGAKFQEGTIDTTKIATGIQGNIDMGVELGTTSIGTTPTTLVTVSLGLSAQPDAVFLLMDCFIDPKSAPYSSGWTFRLLRDAVVLESFQEGNYSASAAGTQRTPSFFWLDDEATPSSTPVYTLDCTHDGGGATAPDCLQAVIIAFELRR